MRRLIIASMCTLVAFAMTVAPSLAAQEHHDSAPESEHDSGHADGEEGGHESGHESGHHFHRNLIAGFVGITGEDRRDRGLTVGLDYNRWVTERFGIGVGVEHAFGGLDFTVYTVPLSWRTGAWKFFAGPGLEDSDHHHGTEFLFRTGVEYAFEVGRMEISPKFMLDFIDGDFVVVAGVAFGRGF